jgi:cytidylate kinase
MNRDKGEELASASERAQRRAKKEREHKAAEELLTKLEERGNMAVIRPQVPGSMASNTTKVELTIFELDFVLNLARYALAKDIRP